MGGERDPNDTNPYATQTAQNTQAPWLGSGTPVDVDLDGLREYAKHMLDQQLDLASRSSHLTHLFDMPNAAWNGAVLGEAAYIRSQLTANASELTTYLGHLGQTLFNIGSAAQTVADIYNAADATSAADLSDVLFAFGDKSVPRPAGLPPNLGQTYFEAVLAGTSPAIATPADSAQWSAPTQTENSPFHTTQVSAGPDGQTREIVTTNPPGGPVVVTTTVYGPDRQVLSRTSTSTTTTYDATRNTLTQSVETSQGGQRTGTTTTVTQYDGGVVTDRRTTTTDALGRPTGTRTEHSDPTTGEQIETTTTVDDGNKTRVTDRVVVGRETEGQTTVQEPIAERYDPYANGAG